MSHSRGEGENGFGHNRRRLTAAGVLAIIASAAVARPASAQTFFNWVGSAGGNWGTDTNWNPASVPDSTSADVFVGSPTVDADFTVGRMTVDASGTVTIVGTLNVAGHAFADAGNVVNHGHIVIASGGALGTSSGTSGVTLSGGGSIVLQGGGSSIGPLAAGFVGRFINADNTISGAGRIGSLASGSAGLAFTNRGTVDANVPASGGSGTILTVDFEPGTQGISSGTLQASNGGILAIIGSVNNDGGTIQALDNSSVQLSVDIAGGTLTTSGTGAIRVGHDGASLTDVANGGAIQVLDGATLTLNRTVANSGTITLGAGGAGATLNTGPPSGAVLGGATLTGSGSVLLGGAGNTITGTLTNQGNTIHGAGVIDAALTNAGVVDADSNGNVLEVRNNVVNSGTMRASNGGQLLYNFKHSPSPRVAGTIDNTGGTIAAGDGSSVIIRGNAYQTAVINGGMLATEGSGTITGTNVQWNGVANAGNYVVPAAPSGGPLSIQGETRNSGSIHVNPGAMLFVGNAAGFGDQPATVTLSGGGTIILDNATLLDGTQPGVYSTLVNQDNTIHGTGEIAVGFVTNHGLISADVPHAPPAPTQLILNLADGSANSGTIQAVNGALLAIDGRRTPTTPVVDNTDGTIQALDGSIIQIQAVNLSRGTLRTVGSGLILLNKDPRNEGSLLNLTLAGNVELAQKAAWHLGGALTNSGSLTLDEESSFSPVPGAPSALFGFGTLVLKAKASISGMFLVSQSSLVLDDQTTLRMPVTQRPGTGALRSISLAPTAVFDFGNNGIAFHYGNGADPAAQIRGLLVSGFANGQWTGPGINTSAADHSHGVGYADSADGVAGIPQQTVLVRYTLYGDANLDGTVNFTDLLALAQHYRATNANWDQGDFNYDGGVGFDDLLLLAQNYGQEFPPPVQATPVPEATMAGAAIAVLIGGRRRRRRV